MLTLDALSDALETTIGEGLLAVPASIKSPERHGAIVEVYEPDALLSLLRLARVCYLASTAWSADHALEITCMLERPDPVLSVAAKQAIPTGEIVVVALTFAIDGLLHRAVGTDPRMQRILDALTAQHDREYARYEAEMEEAQEAARERDAAVDEVRATLAADLVADPAWLVKTSWRQRQVHAERILASRYPEYQREQKMRSALIDVLTEAIDLRDNEIVPARLAAFTAAVNEHARVVTGGPAYEAATTKDARRAVIDAYVRATDPLVPPRQVRTALMAAADALRVAAP